MSLLRSTTLPNIYLIKYILFFIFRRNKSNFRDDQTNLATAQSSLNSNDTTHPTPNIRR